mgnify:CR=1 FL=1
MSNSVLGDLLLYADDSMLLVSGKNVKEIESKLECEMGKLSKCLESNRLSLHLGKTETILFGLKRKLKKLLKLLLNEKFLKKFRFLKFLKIK